ncbi:restriction endonuclease subunit S [Acinetobacter junii]
MIHVTKGEMEGKIIHIPVLTEQIPIGNFFQNLDQSIALHEKKLSQTQNLKKAMLEKMFPKVGNKQPEIRLKGFSGDWDTISLGSLCSIGDIDHRMPESTKSGIPYLMTGDFFGINGLDFENAKLISNEDYEQLSKKIKPEIGDILFARYASVGTVRLVVTDVKFLISYSCAILKTSVNSNGEYLFYWFQNSFAQNQIEQEINTGSQRNIGIDSLKKLSVILPKTNEQKAIAYFFKSLDETLALQQQQLQTLKNLKQSFLEKMFV